MARHLNWREVLTENRVPFVERGANVKRGEINIRCPYCGSADPSYHMGLSLETGYWACWRNSDHRGKSPIRLLVQLLRISYKEAFALAGLTPGYVDPDGFSEAVSRIMGRGLQQTAEAPAALAFPKTFRPIDFSMATRKHGNYLYQRGFASTNSDVSILCRVYDLQADVGGAYRDRIILPYYVDGVLVAWSARAIAQATIRYKDLPLDDCLIPIKQTFYNHDALHDLHSPVLVVVEGPFDALKLDFYGKDCGVRAVALSTNSITEAQIMLLHEHASHFSSCVVMLDQATALGVVDSMRLKQKLAGIENVKISGVPYGRKDAGEMTPSEVYHFSRELQHGCL